MAHSFVRVIVQIHVRDFDVARRQRIRIDAEAMILRGDFHFLREQIFHRMVRAVMPEFQFEGLSAEREAAKLMSEADAEDRHAAEQFANIRNRVSRSARDRRARSKGKRRRGLSARTSSAEVFAGTTVTSQP